MTSLHLEFVLLAMGMRYMAFIVFSGRERYFWIMFAFNIKRTKLSGNRTLNCFINMCKLIGWLLINKSSNSITIFGGRKVILVKELVLHRCMPKTQSWIIWLYSILLKEHKIFLNHEENKIILEILLHLFFLIFTMNIEWVIPRFSGLYRSFFFILKFGENSVRIIWLCSLWSQRDTCKTWTWLS